MLPKFLRAGEGIRDLCHGTAEGRSAALIATSRRVIFLQRHGLFRATVESVPMEHLRAAQEHVGVRYATVTVNGGGRVFQLHDVDHALAHVFCSRLRERIQRVS